MSFLGTPCWYELTTSDGAQAQAFYGAVLKWTFSDSGMPDMNYTLAKSDGDMVAGLYQPNSEMPLFWMIYFAVPDCDQSVARVRDLGGSVHVEPADIPGTGRFAIVTDPLGAAFGLLQPLDAQPGTAFDQTRSGFGNWNELTTPDPVAAMAFYGALLGFTTARAVPMGEVGDYHVIGLGTREIGGVMRNWGNLPNAWTPYFGTEGVKATIERITAAGGSLLSGPHEVPGGAFTARATDPQGAMFALVGPI